MQMSLIPGGAPVLALFLACASCGSTSAGPPSTGAAPATAFPNDGARLSACLDLRDHIVDLYASQYIVQHDMDLSDTQEVAFRHAWTEELAKKGTFERFERSCFSGLTPVKFRCGMASKTPGAIVLCMNADHAVGTGTR
jgi:hypothetical protein